MLTFSTLNSLINGSTNRFFEYFIGFVFLMVIPSMWSILSAPFTSPDMLWIVTPLLISMTLMQLYFGRNRDEELGWNTAFGNSISLIFVSINLLQFIYNQFGWSGFNIINPVSNKIYLVLVLGLISLVQLIVNYYHLISKRIAFFINSAVPTNMTAYISIVLVYTDIPLNLSTFFAAFCLLALFIVIFNWFKSLIPMSEEAENYTKRIEALKLRELAARRKLELRQERAASAKLIDSVISVGVVVLCLLLFLIVKSFIIMPLWVDFLVQSIIYLVIVIIFLIKRGLNIHNLNFDGETSEALLGVVLGFPLFVLISGLVYVLWFFVPKTDRLELLAPAILNNLASPWLNVLIFVFLIPFSVELFYRGFVQRSLKAHVGSHFSVVTQAIIFSLISFSFSILNGLFTPFMLLSIPVFFVSGLVLGYLRDRWGLECSITTHMSFNAFGLLLFFMGV